MKGAVVKITLIMAGLLMVGLILASCGGGGSGEKGNLYYEPHDPADAFTFMVGCAIPYGEGETVSLDVGSPNVIAMPLSEGEFVDVPWISFPEHYYESYGYVSVGIEDPESPGYTFGPYVPSFQWGQSDFYGFIVRLSRSDDDMEGLNIEWYVEVHMDEGSFMESLYAQTAPPATVQQVSLP